MYNKLLIAIDLADLKSAKYVVDTALQMTAKNPNAVYRVVSIIEPVDNSLISAFLPKNFDKEVVVEANQKLHEFTKTIFLKVQKCSTLWRMVRFMKKFAVLPMKSRWI